MNSAMTWIVAALYKFTPMQDRAALRLRLKSLCAQHSVYGTLLLADEGINGTICAPARDDMDAVLSVLRSLSGLEDLDVKFSEATRRPFRRMKIRLKKEIVTLRQPQADPAKQVGIYVDPKDWNALISDPDMIVLDTRNDYETEIGTFKGAIDPKTIEFTQFPAFVKQHLDPAKHKKIAMFCTGGIRCEKASSYMLAEGFGEVYHLKGGILKYLETVPARESLWDGQCYVFDHRVSVGHGLAEGHYDYCFGCGFPIDETGKTDPSYEEGISCKRCIGDLTPEKRRALSDRHAYLRTQKGVA